MEDDKLSNLIDNLPTTLQEVGTSIVALLAVAAEPLSIDAIEAWLLRREFPDEPDRASLERALAVLSGLLKRTVNPDGEDGFTLFDHSVRLHILNYASLQQTVRRLSKSLANESLRPLGDALEVYLLRHGVRHLIDVGQRDDALRLATGFDFLLRGSAVWSSPAGLLKDGMQIGCCCCSGLR